MSVTTATPGQLQVIKRTGEVAAFDAEKISVAIGKAFLAVEGQPSAESRFILKKFKIKLNWRLCVLASKKWRVLM